MKSRFLFITISLGRCYSSLVQQDQRSKTDEELNNSKIAKSTQSSKPAESDFEEIMAVDEEESERQRTTGAWAQHAARQTYFNRVSSVASSDSERIDRYVKVYSHVHFNNSMDMCTCMLV